MSEFAIPQSEFEARLAATREAMAAQGLDLLLAFSTESEPAHVRYYADYWPSFETAAVLISVDGPAALLIGPESRTYATARTRIGRVIQLMDFRESSQPDYPGSRLPTWRDIAAEFRPRRVGIAGWHMFPHTILTALREAVGAAVSVVPADAVVRAVSMRKSANELRCLREAARLSEIGFRAVLEGIRPGLTECQLVGLATGAMLAAGAEATGYPIWCCSGPNSAQAISRPSLRPVQTGEVIHFSIGAKVAGYSASIGRPVVLGHCPDELRRFLQVGLDAETMTIDLMRAGTAAASVAQRVHDFIRSKGYGDAILYGPAHGCGQMECEYPFLETSSTYTLEEAMAFMVDIFLSRAGQGFRWEDGIVVRNGPAEELSSFGRRLNILEV